jgi:hypothetical protein
MYGRLIQGVDDRFGLKTTSAQITGISTVTDPAKTAKQA